MCCHIHMCILETTQCIQACTCTAWMYIHMPTPACCDCVYTETVSVEYHNMYCLLNEPLKVRMCVNIQLRTTGVYLSNIRTWLYVLTSMYVRTYAHTYVQMYLHPFCIYVHLCMNKFVYFILLCLYVIHCCILV